jgi:CheY-like chemotaxis protein
MTPKMKKTILLADDDFDDASFFCEALRQIDPNIDCLCATDGVEALDVLQSNERPDIIFLDINMPRMNGWEFLRKIKCIDEFKEIPVLVYSTSTRSADINTALDLGALCFFAKPNRFSDLKSILEVVTNNLDENLLEAIGHFNYIKSKKIFSCSEDE